MKKTIKYKLLKLMEGRGTIARKDLCLLIFKAQGKTGKEAQTYRPGYYGTNLQQWVREGLLEKPEGGGYKLGRIGKQFIDNPELTHVKIRTKKSRDRIIRLENWVDFLKQKLSDAEMKLKDINYIINNNNNYGNRRV